MKIVKLDLNAIEGFDCCDYFFCYDGDGCGVEVMQLLSECGALVSIGSEVSGNCKVFIERIGTALIGGFDTLKTQEAILWL